MEASGSSGRRDLVVSVLRGEAGLLGEQFGPGFAVTRIRPSVSTYQA